MQTTSEFISKHNITMTAVPIASNPNMTDMPAGSRHWCCKLRRTTREGFASLDVPFSQGPALKDDPTAADVLDCLASDASGIENAEDFEDWASEYGYDPDSRKAEAIFNACKAQSGGLRRLLGEEAYQELLWETERD